MVGPARGFNLKNSARAGLEPPFCDFKFKKYIRVCEDQTEPKFHRIILHLKRNLEKIGRFKI